jgi:hypothetical protein
MADSPVPVQQASFFARSRVWLVASLLLVLVQAIPNITYPIARDQATYCVMGRGLLQGKHLYTDFWDNRSPALAYIYAAIVKVFGPVMWSVGLVDILWLLLISYLIFRFTERYLGTGAAVIAVVVSAYLHIRAGYWQAGQAETFLMVFVFVPFFLMGREGPDSRLRQVAAGLLFGAAFWTKYNALAFLPVVVLLPYLDTSGLDDRPCRLRLRIPWWRWLAAAATFALGLGAAIAAVLVYFRMVNTWDSFVEDQFVVLPRYAEMALERTPSLSLWALNRTFTTLGQWTEVVTGVALLLAWRQRELKRLAPILLAALLGYLSVALQVRFHPYAFETCFPFFAMFWGYVCVKFFHGVRRVARACEVRGWRLAGVLVWVLFANLAVWPLPKPVANLVAHYRELGAWWREGDLFYTSYAWSNPISHFPDQMRVISYLRENLRPGDSVFVWGSEPLIYFLTGTSQPTRFVLNLPLVSPWSPPAWRDEVVAELEKSPPRFFVVARDDAIPFIAYTHLDSEEYLRAYPELAIFVSDYYELAENLQYFVIYRRPEPSAEGGAVALRPSQWQR